MGRGSGPVRSPGTDEGVNLPERHGRVLLNPRLDQRCQLVLQSIDHGIGMVDWHHFSSDRDTARENVAGEVEYAALDLIHGITSSFGGDVA